LAVFGGKDEEIRRIYGINSEGSAYEKGATILIFVNL
jgi:hypothetical protein